ncbi:MAG: cytochrome c oxidase subunit 4, partial [Candidatus Eremiobacteraeota bacterium]|nr:cytochrome c oxidase subunit 4 [Candidatus Eremiobacteraeota bacterium]
APSALAGEQIGVFSVESPWPIVLALSTAGLLIGVVIHPMLAVFSAAAFFAIIWGLAKESV